MLKSDQLNVSINCGCQNNYRDYSEYHVAMYLWKICPPVLLLLGTFGNSLSILVLRRPAIRKSGCSICFTALAYIDLIVLYTGLLRQWILHTFNFDVRTTSSESCKIHTWILYSSLDLSAWILIAVTIERVLIVWFPNKVKSACPQKTAIKTSFAIALFLLLVNSHILYGFVLDETQNSKSTFKKQCSSVSESYGKFWRSTWPFIDLLVFCIIPFSVLLVGNFLIFVKVLLSRRRINRHKTTNSGKQKQKQRDSNFSSMTIIIVTVNSVFLLCNFPIGIFMVAYPSWRFETCGRKHAKLELFWCVVNICMYMNNSVNFLLYILSGRKFRNELKDMFRRNSRYHVTSALIPSRESARQQQNTVHLQTMSVQIVVESNCGK